MKWTELVEFIKSARLTADDATALSGVELYPYWNEGLSVNVGERYQYEGILYKCVQVHTTQADWTPDVTSSLWVKVSLEEFPEWVQPTGGHDAYNTGDKVTHNGVKYVSNIDANTTEPGTDDRWWSEYVE